MNLDFDTLEALRRQHPAWRLLAAESAPLVASFLHRVFVVPNRRVIAQADLVEALDDNLFALRQQRVPAPPGAAATERALAWLHSIGERGFLGTQSRLDAVRACRANVRMLDGQCAPDAAGVG